MADRSDTPGPSPYLAYGVLAAVIIATMFRLCTAEFSGWDDEQYVARNPVLASATVATLGHYWNHEFFALYAPVTGTVLAALALVGRAETPDPTGVVLNPFVFHSFNLLLHVIASSAVFHVLWRMLRNGWTALAGALVFAVHPVQVETVGWTTGIKDLLGGLGSIGAVALYLAAIEADSSRRRRLYGAAIGVFVLALLSKASAMTTAAVVLAIDLLWYRRPTKTAVLWALPWFVLAALAAIVARHLQPPLQVAYDVPLWARPLIAGHALSFYLGKLVWPARLGFDYGQSPEVVMATRWVYFAWIIPVLLLAIAAGAYRRGLRWPLVALAVFVLAPFHVLGWVPFDFQFYSTTADHYLYVAMLGVALAFGAAIAHLPRKLSAGVVVVVISTLAVRSFVQTDVWQTTMTFVNNGIRVNPDSFGFHGSLAVIENARGHRQQALHHANRAVEIQPRYWNSYLDRGNIRLALGDVGGAIEDYRQAMELTDEEPRVYVSLGGALAATGRLDEAERHLAQGLRLDPDQPDGLLHYGTIQMRRGRLDHARQLLSRAVALQPANVRLRTRLARVLLAMDRRAEATRELETAQELDANYPELQETLRLMQGSR